MGRWLILTLATLAGTATADDGAVRFRDQVAPILVSRCVACHGPKKAAGKFRLDTYARLMSESEAGRSIEPGKPDDSLCLELIESNEPTGRMPKNADPLPPAEVATLRRWIEQGAKFDGLDPNADLAASLPRTPHPAAPLAYRAALPILALAFRPDGRELAAGGYHEITLWEPVTGRLARRLPGLARRTQGLAYNAEGTLLAVAGGVPGESGELALVDPSGTRPPRVVATSADLFLGVAFSPDGSMVAASGADRSLRVHEVATGKELCQIRQFADGVTGVAFSPDGASVAGSSLDKLVKVFDPRTGTLQATYIGHQAAVFAVGFDPESNRAVTAGADRKVHAWDPKTIAAEDGTAGQQEDRFKKELASRMTEGFADDVLALTLAPGRAFAASADGQIRELDLKQSRIVRTIDGPGDWVYALAFSPKSGWLAAGGADGSIRVWDQATGQRVGRFLAAPGLAAR